MHEIDAEVSTRMKKTEEQNRKADRSQRRMPSHLKGACYLWEELEGDLWTLRRGNNFFDIINYSTYIIQNQSY
jgi:hypothetical protein